MASGPTNPRAALHSRAADPAIRSICYAGGALDPGDREDGTTLPGRSPPYSSSAKPPVMCTRLRAEPQLAGPAGPCHFRVPTPGNALPGNVSRNLPLRCRHQGDLGMFPSSWSGCQDVSRALTWVQPSPHTVTLNPLCGPLFLGLRACRRADLSSGSAFPLFSLPFHVLFRLLAASLIPRVAGGLPDALSPAASQPSPSLCFLTRLLSQPAPNQSQAVCE